MKHYIYNKPLFINLLLAAACIMTGCSSDNPDVGPVKEQQEMKFVADDITRSTTSTINYAGSRFALFGDMKYSTSIPLKVFHNMEVEYDGHSWKYEGTQYWIPNYEHSFVAIHPAAVFKNTAEPTYSESKLSFEYALPVTGDVTLDKERISDLLVATHRRTYSEGGDGTVSLRFGHLMSLVNVAPAFSDNLMGNDDYILIHRLELTGIYTSARFDVFPANLLSNSQTDDKAVDITPSKKRNTVIVLPTPVKVNNHQGNVNLFSDNNAIMLIPQTFGADSDASLIFYFSINEDKTQRQVTLPLNNLKWDAGKSNLYKVTFERSGLVLDKCEITAWNEIRGNDITVD